MKSFVWRRAWASALVSATLSATAYAQAPAPLRIGIVTYLSGPAAASVGIPAKEAAELMIEAFNAGTAPAPYGVKGFGGSPIEIVLVDEAGGTTTQVTEFRNLVQKQNVDLVVGYIGSGDCLAVAPLAEELRKLTVLFNCGTSRIFEEASYKYVFRTSMHSGMESLALAKYLKESEPSMKRLGAINQNYAFGQDSWADFEAALKATDQSYATTTVQFPQFLAGQYNAEISALLQAKSDVVFSSLWGGDLEAFLLQASPRGLLKRSTFVFPSGEPQIYKFASQFPDGTVIGARGVNGPFAPDAPLNRWFRALHAKKDRDPNFAAYHMANALLGVKLAWEKAVGSAGKRPTTEQFVAALESSSWDVPGGRVSMRLGKGHQAVHQIAFGKTKNVGGKIQFTDVKTYQPDQIAPPEGVKFADWLTGGMKR